MSELLAVRSRESPRLVQEGVEPRGGVCRGRRHARIEIQVEADGETLVGLEGRKLAEILPVDRSRQGFPPVLSGPVATYTIGTTGRRMPFTTSEEPESEEYS